MTPNNNRASLITLGLTEETWFVSDKEFALSQIVSRDS
jgi:hypothetical protein